MSTSPHSHDRETEAAYRRGYAQGAYIALEAYREGIAQRRIYSWYNAVVSWRYALSNTRTPTRRNWRCPPEPFVIEASAPTAAVSQQGGRHE